MTNDKVVKKQVPRWITIFFFLSCPGAVLLTFRMVYEMSYFTWLNGPQNIGFSLVHNNLFLFIYFVISIISFVLWIIIFVIWHVANIKAISNISIVQFGLSILILILFLLPYGFYQRITIQLLGNNNHQTDTFLYSAAIGDMRTTKFFIEKGVNVNTQNKDGRTALMSACVGNKMEIIKLLLKNGSEINIKDSESNSALDEAVSMGHIDIARFLIENGADMNSLKRILQQDSLMYINDYSSDKHMSNDYYMKRDSLINILFNEYKNK